MKTKLLFWAVLFLLSRSFYAQISTQQQQVVVQPDNPQLETNTLLLPFTDLDKSKIETGLLLDAGMEFADLKKYNGIPTDSSFTSSKIISDVYSTLIMSKISSNGGTLKDPNSFQNEWYANQTVDLITVAGMYFKYNQFSESNQNAFKNMASSFTTNRTANVGTSSLAITPQNKIVDVYSNGIWQNPYDINNVFAMSPITNSHNKLHFNVVFPATLFVSNYGSQVSSLEVKFSDNSNFQAIKMDQLISVNYPAIGEYIWTYRLTLTNGQVLYSKNKFIVSGDLEKYIDIGSSGSNVNNLTSNGQWKVELEKYQYFIPFPPTVVNKPKLTLYIKLREGQTQITKPFIVAEGFDSGHITSPKQEGGDNTIETFLGNINQYSQLGVKLNDYDIIYVDWGIGTDYIQNNAELFKKAIRWVNQHKIGNAKNVVMGQSMGGLIARYALKDMEDNAENHDANLFISHDSPHLGANTPISLQYMMRNISKTFLRSPIVAGINYMFTPIFTGGAPISDIFSVADTPASRQMLINYVNNNYTIDNSVHDTWQNTLKAKGYPQLTRNVAISNGSECGTDQNLQNLLSYHYVSKGWFIDIVGSLIGGVTLDPWQLFISILPGESRYHYDFDAYPMTKLNESKQLYSGKIVYKKKILWAIPAQNTLLSGTRNQPNNILPIDKYGGGKFRFPISSMPSFIKDNASVSYFSFVPTPSALDYKFGNSVLNEEDYQKTYSPVDDASNVPFVNFVAEQIGNSQSENNNHISFSTRNRQFIINQLSGIPSQQNEKITTSYLCGSNVKIGGEAILCGNSNVTYTTGFAPTIQWSIVEGANLVDVTGPYNQPQLSFTPKQNVKGLVKLQTYLAGGGASNTVTKNIWIGPPAISVSQINDPSFYYKSEFFLSDYSGNPVNINDQGITQIKWTKVYSNPSTVRLFAMNNHTEAWATGDDNFWNMDVKVEVTNACGTTEYIAVISPPASEPCDTYILAKASSTENTYVVMRPPVDPCNNNKNSSNTPSSSNNTSNKNELFNIKVANSMGVIIIDKMSDSFDLSSYPTGTYIVNITKDNKVIINQTIVKY
ncbi:alpha/beta hydrolase [Chryseobacterium sp. T1]